MIQAERIQPLNDEPARSGDYVLYWMQHAQRARGNHALQHAIRAANARRMPLLAVFGLTPDFPAANARAYTFMLQGLRETQTTLAERGIRLLARRQAPPEAVATLATGAALVITDRGYLRVERAWREAVARGLDRSLVQVEGDVVIPVETASGKEEYAAYTLRPRIERQLHRFLVPLEEVDVARDSLALDPLGGEYDADLDDVPDLLAGLGVAGGVAPVDAFHGGSTRAEASLETFLTQKLARYADGRNEPSADLQSHLSPYLHFGQISPLTIALRVQEFVARRSEEAGGDGVQALVEGRDAFLEELIVRRELSMNFCHYSAVYDSLACLPDWARETLAEHATDHRQVIYAAAELERAETHDPYWNAAQRQMLLTGKMHGYMRMYWVKKILEWTPDPATAHSIALALNDRYELDGRDPNGFAGVAWCFGKHDRAWQERPVYGKVRIMTSGGLERKFDIDTYVEQIEAPDRAGADRRRS